MPGLAPFKQQALMRDLKMRLQITISGAAYVESLDASSNPILSITRNGETMWIKIEDVGNAGRVDALGIAQTAYSPHKTDIIQLADADAIDDEMRAKVLAECVKSFTEVWLYSNPAVSFPASYDLTSATLKAVIRSDAVNPLTSQQ